MLAPALLFALAAVRPSPDALTELSKGSALYRVCQAEVRVMDQGSVRDGDGSDILNGSYCVGYMNGYMGNLHRDDAVCTGGAPVGLVVRAYVLFMDKNPNLLGEERQTGVNLALRDAFPCPVDGTVTNTAGKTSHSAL